MKQAGGETLYLKVDRNVQVHDKKVTIGDLAQILCTDKQTENLVKPSKCRSDKRETGAAYDVGHGAD